MKVERKTLIPFGKTQDHSIDYLLGILEDARVTTLQVIQNITQEELHWQYAKGWNTIGVLLSHFISCGHYFRIEFIEGRHLSQEERKIFWPGLEMGKYIPELIIPNKTVAEYIEELDYSQQLLFDKIQSLDSHEFFKKREGYNPNTGNNLAWVLYHLAEDEVHHRGQITILKKLYQLENKK